jgi:hypothetical protein
MALGSIIQVAPDGTITLGGVAPLGGIPSVLNLNADGSVTIVNAQVVPLRPVPAQRFQVTLSGQPVTLNLYARALTVPVAGQIVTDPPVFYNVVPTFIDVYVNDALVVGGVICRNQTLIVRDPYLGLVGDLAFQDLEGTDDPIYTGLGARFALLYFPVV